MNVPRLLSAIALIACCCPLPALAQQAASPVEVTLVREKSLAAGQTFVGTVMPAKRSAVGSAVDGRVTEYPINEGERVAKGQALCKLLTETISLQIAAAEADLRLRQEELRELKNGSRKEEIAQTKARVEALQAMKDYTNARHKRAVALAQQGQTITQEQLEENLAMSVEADRKLQAEQQGLAMMIEGPRPEKILQAEAKVQGQEELVAQLKDQLKKHTMIAPFDGYVVSEKTEVGEWVTRAQVVAEIVYLDEVEIEAHVLDSHIDYVRVGMPVRVEVPALREPLYVGAVARISPQADVKSRTFPVKINVKNAIREDGPVLKSGMLARVTLPVGAAHPAKLVPKDSIVFGGPVPMVYLVTAAPPAEAAAGKSATAKSAGAEKPSEIVRPVPVELGVADGRWIEVQADLKPGDRVVILGNERLRPGAPVSILREVDPDAKSPTPEKKSQ